MGKTLKIKVTFELDEKQAMALLQIYVTYPNPTKKDFIKFANSALIENGTNSTIFDRIEDNYKEFLPMARIYYKKWF